MDGDTGYSWRHWRCVSGRTISNLNTHSEDVGGWYDLSAEDQTKVMADLERGWQLGKTEGVGKKRVEAWEKDDTKDVSWKVKMVESGAVVPEGWRKLKGSTPEAGKGAEEGGDGEGEKGKGKAKAKEGKAKEGKAKEGKAKEGKASAKEVTVIELVDEEETPAVAGKGKGKKAEKKKEEKKEEEKPKPKPRKKKEVVEAVPKVEEKKPATRMTRNSRRAAEEAEAMEKAAKEGEGAEEAMQKLSM